MPTEIKSPFIKTSRIAQAMAACRLSHHLSERDIELVAISLGIIRASLEAAENPFYNGQQKQMAAGIVATFQAYGGNGQEFFKLLEQP